MAALETIWPLCALSGVGGVRTDVHSRCLLSLLLPRKNVATFWLDIVGRSVCDPYPDENQKNLVV